MLTHFIFACDSHKFTSWTCQNAPFSAQHAKLTFYVMSELFGLQLRLFRAFTFLANFKLTYYFFIFFGSISQLVLDISTFGKL